MHYRYRVDAIKDKAAAVKLSSQEWLALAIEVEEIAKSIGGGDLELEQMISRYMKYAVVMERKGL